ncbi:MAG TPA: hypothetical protein VI564_02590 [Candidatus Nanoarchaeia archaeon]|nr:hypothetical protein [Candidatus Nanoarchaeia archaeon]
MVPNNKSLGNYVEITLNYLGNPSKDKLVVSRGEDVPFIVESLPQNGKVVLGLTGRDLFKEYELSNYNTKLRIIRTISWKDNKAMFGKPALCLLGPNGKKLTDLPKKLKVCINSKYKNLAKKYLNILEDLGYRFAKIYLSGSTESAFSNGISDLVIDIVYTGSSIKKANLGVYDKIFESDFVIIGKENSLESLQGKGEKYD